MNTNSNTYTIVYASVLVVIVAFLLAFVASALKPTQDANVAIDKKQQILKALNLRDVAKADVEKTYSDVVVSDPVYGKDLNVKEEKGGFEKATKELTEDCMPLYICNVDGKTVYVVPVKGAGLWGGIWGYVSIESDGNTVRSAYFNHESETAGLGAEIKDNVKWQHQFDGKKLYSSDNADEVVLSVLKAGKEPEIAAENRVDAVTGATLTSNGVNTMLREGLGRYSEILKKLTNTNIEPEETASDSTEVSAPAA